MLKRLISFLCLAALLLTCVPAVAADAGADALTLAELRLWVDGYRQRAMETTPLNDPTDEAYLTEDGYALIYDFATFYTDSPKMTEDTVIREIVLVSPSEACPRGVTVDALLEDVLASYYNENEELAGTSEYAVLYFHDLLPSDAQWARVTRDGQRVQSVQYAVHEQLATGGDGYTSTGLLFTISDGRVTAIRAYGLDSRLEEEDVRTILNGVETALSVDDYHMVPTSVNGAELSLFDESDLIFSDIDFLTITPEEASLLLGECYSDVWMEDEGGFLRTMEFSACTLTFVYDADKANPRADVFSLASDGLEGPRAIRVGDTLTSVISRFHYGEGAFDGTTEVLYGTYGTAPYGLADYGDGTAASLYYGAQLEDGRTVVLYMSFEFYQLTELILYFE